MKRYTTTTKALVTISFPADDDKHAEENIQKIIKHIRENAIDPGLSDVRVEIDPEGWHTSFSI